MRRRERLGKGVGGGVAQAVGGEAEGAQGARRRPPPRQRVRERLPRAVAQLVAREHELLEARRVRQQLGRDGAAGPVELELGAQGAVLHDMPNVSSSACAIGTIGILMSSLDI